MMTRMMKRTVVSKRIAMAGMALMAAMVLQVTPAQADGYSRCGSNPSLCGNVGERKSTLKDYRGTHRIDQYGKRQNVRQDNRINNHNRNRFRNKSGCRKNCARRM